MNISKTIRISRYERGLTQEQLAEKLGVSVSAVSQWESAKTAPDLSLIAPLCNLLGISADQLFGIDLEKRDERVKSISREANDYFSRGYHEDAERIVRDGLAEFPGDSRLSADLLHILYSKRCAHSDSVTTEEIIRIGEDLLETSTDSDARETATQILIYIYNDIGESEKAFKMADSRPFMVLSREFLMTHIGNRDERYKRTQLLLNLLVSYTVTELCSYPHCKREDGSDFYNPDERFELSEKQIALCELFWEDGNLGFEHTRMCNTQYKQALYFAGKGEYDEALSRLEKSVEHALAFLDFAECGREFRYTSLILRGMNGGSFTTGNDDNEATELLKLMKNPTLDPIRADMRFCELEKRLEEHAGKWEIVKR